MSEHLDESKIFKSLASSSRISILTSLEKQPMNYTELMRVAGIDKKTGSGKFAHHLKMLFTAGLVRVNDENKLYELTPKGVQVVKILKEMRSSLLESGRIKVRRSNSLIEDFDRNKISKVLFEEAGMPAKTADRVAKAMEERLEKMQIEHLTAPLIRELVNAYLVEQGMESYRNKLARLGLPVADVDTILEEHRGNSSFTAVTHKVALSVFREYALTKIIPREAAERYYAGEIDLEGIETWAFSVYSRLYESDEMNSAVKEVDGVEFETVFKDPPVTDSTFGLVLDCVAEKNKRASAYFSDVSKTDFVGVRRLHVLLPFDKFDTSSTREAEFLFSRMPASSEGHPFEESGMILGKASINVAGLYLKSGSSEKKFWDELRSAIESVNSAFKNKRMHVEKYWRTEGFRFVVSLVGVEEVERKAGFSRHKIFVETERECRGMGEDYLLLMASKSSQRAAERLKKLDTHIYGAKEVERLTQNRTYSWNITLAKASEVREMLKYFSGGLSARLPLKEAENLRDLKPLVVLPP
ncbi:MAG: hypothetical protein RMI49_03615 [Candidatus Caldarchaeum sp.]|nr:hypothetical protein [Candidatus Caldarchaeum sp.]